MKTDIPSPAVANLSFTDWQKKLSQAVTPPPVARTPAELQAELAKIKPRPFTLNDESLPKLPTEAEMMSVVRTAGDSLLGQLGEMTRKFRCETAIHETALGVVAPPPQIPEPASK